MRGKFRRICVIGCAAVLLAGYSGNTGTSDGPDADAPTKEQDATIFDKIVQGDSIGGEISLYDISGMVWDGSGSLLSVCAYKEKYIIALYSGDGQSKAVVYDVSDGDVYKEIAFDDILSNIAYADITGSGLPYVYDEVGEIFYVLNIKNEKYTAYQLGFVPESMLVSDSGNRIYYTLKDDSRVYQYITETAQSSVAYDASSEASQIVLESVDTDDSTLIVKILTNDYEGYAKLSVEMQQMDRLDAFESLLYYGEGNYMYTSPEYPQSVCVYNELKPRTFLKFDLEETAELDRTYVYSEGPYIFTIAASEDASMLRFYNVAGGIMENETALPSDYAITRVSYMKDMRALCFTTVDPDGVTGAVIWDVEAISNIIS